MEPITRKIIHTNAHSQDQSPFFAKLPPEIRYQIETEYLVKYLWQTAQSSGARYLLARWHMTHYSLQTLCSLPLSPLSLCCKRMFHEMRGNGADDDDDAAAMAAPANLAVLYCATRYNTEIESCFRVNSCGLYMEGTFAFDRLRRLRFINETDEPSYHAWVWAMQFIVEESRNLTEIQLEWNPMMSFLPTNSANADKLIGYSKSVRTVRLRGNVPLLWEEQLKSLSRVQVLVEPLLWDEREDKAMQEEAAHALRAARVRARDMERHKAMEDRIAWEDVAYGKKSWRARMSRCCVVL